MHNRQLTGIANYWVIRPFRIYSTVIVLVAVQINIFICPLFPISKKCGRITQYLSIKLQNAEYRNAQKRFSLNLPYIIT